MPVANFKEVRMSAKKIYVSAVSALLLFIAFAGFILGALSFADRGIPAEAFDGKVEAMQFGDIPKKTTVAGRKYHPEITLSTQSAKLYATTDTETQIYELLLDGLRSEKAQIFLSGMNATIEQVRAAYSEVLNTCPELFFVGTQYRYGSADDVTVEYVIPTYTLGGSALTTARQEYETLVSEILSQVEPSWSELEKVLFIHDYIVKNFEYDYSYTIYDAYGFLKNKKGVCQSYTLLCIELLTRLDIGVGSVPSQPMNHIWNCVEIGGKWYHMDITWDDASASGNIDRFDDVSYDSFLCSDSAIATAGTDGHNGWVSDITFSDDYDDLFIKTVGSKIDISPLGEDWYLLVKGGKNENSGISLSLIDFENNTYTQVTHIKTKWYAWGSTSSYYLDIFAGFGRYFDSLVISTSNELYGYNPSAGLVKLGDYTYSDGYICGMRINGSQATFRVAQNPSSYVDNRHTTIDLSSISFDLEVSCKNKAGEVIGSDTVSVGWGKDFSVNTPTIESHATDTLTLGGTMPLGGIRESVTYRQFATLKIEYFYRNGDVAHESYINENVEVGEVYSIASPEIEGYFPNIQTVSGTMTAQGVTVTVVYSQDFYSVRITYLYEDGSVAAPEHVINGLVYMSDYSVASPVIAGFTPSVEMVSGKISEDILVTVTYTAARCEVTVKYLYPDGSLIEEKRESFDWGADFEFVSPTFTGYTAETEMVSGRAEQIYTEFTVRYTANKYTLQIQYVYFDGTPAGEDYIEEIAYAEQYSVLSPKFDNFTASVEVVSGTMADGDVTVTVIYTLSKYKVVFMSEGRVFFETELEFGSVIEMPDGFPQKASTAQKIYTFNSWGGYVENMTVEEDITFTAIFDESARKYRVEFKNYDGALLYEVFVEYGGEAVYVGKTPERAPENGVTYTFSGWDEDTDNISCDSVFTAMFSDGVTQYTVSFYDGDGRLVKQELVYHGHSATPPSAPEKASDLTYKYTFDKWVGKYKRVTSDSEVRATYTREYIEYTVVFKNYDGTVLSEQKLHYGDKVTLPEPPARESDERYEYVFSRWSPEVTDAIGNAEYIAIFTAHKGWKFSTQEFISAFEKVQSAKTLKDRFKAINNLISMKEDTDVSDPALADTLEALESEIEKYNADISKINTQFTEANESLATFNSGHTAYTSILWLVWELVKKLLVVR